MDDQIELSVVIPVYQSAATLRTLIQRLVPVLQTAVKSYEIVLVDDGSSDDSWSVLTDLHAKNQDITVVVQLTRNFGQHNALMCGFHYARGRLVMTMDDDLQNPPEEIPKLLEAIRSSDLDVVYGNYASKKHSPLRNLASVFVNAFYRTVFGTNVSVSSFRIIREEILTNILSFDLNFIYIDGLLAWNTQRIGAVLVKHDPGARGQSRYSLATLTKHALNLLTSFSLLPLQVVSAMGIVSSIGGLGTGLYYLVQVIMHKIAVPGYASTIIAILVLGGVQLIALGIIGEYLGRLHLNVNRKPQFCVRRSFGIPAKDVQGKETNR